MKETLLGNRLGLMLEDFDLIKYASENYEELYNKFVTNKFLVIRGHRELTDEEFSTVFTKFGKGVVWDKAFERTEVGEVHRIIHRDTPSSAGKENAWHNETSWQKNPCKAVVINLKVVPTHGSDTLWIDTNKAWENLPNPIRQIVHKKSALHTPPEKNYHTEIVKMTDQQANNGLETSAVHPVVIQHPDTGLWHLYVNPLFTRYIKGMNKHHSHWVLTQIYNTFNTPEFQYRHRWKAGDIVIWDNRSTIHYACSSYYPQYRESRRLMLISTNGEPEWKTVDHLPLPSEAEYLSNNPEFFGAIKRLRNRKKWQNMDITHLIKKYAEE